MKRILLFVLGAMMVLPLCADNYVLQSDGTYSYTGEPVSELSVDFSTWWASYLPSALSDDMALAEKNNLGFVKWKIQKRPCGDKGQVYALFNNNTGDEGVTVANNDANNTNPPRIFLPTTARGVKSITISGYVGGSNSQSIGVFYKDANQSTWKWKANLTLTTTYGEVSVDLNTEGQTSLYLKYDKTAYCTISDLELDIEQPLYVLNSTTGKYDYQGEPIESLSVDFTNWYASYLPSPLYDDMALAEKNGLGFVKWKIQKRPCGDKGQVYALFNNNTGDEGVTVANNVTTNPPRIYLPTTARGVKKITVFGGNSNVTLGIFIKDDEHEDWAWKASLSLVAGFSEVSVDLNTKGQTSIYLEYGSTPYVAITNIDLEIEDPVQPLYSLNTESGKYEYVGEPVDEINVNFSTWAVDDLPTELTDDMPLSEAHGLGFIKWRLPWYNQGVVNQRVLFNNNTGDAGVTEANNVTTNKPAIYFPTTTRGIESIAIRYLGGNPFWLNYNYTDDMGEKSASVQLPASADTDPQTYVLNLNTHGQTSLHFLYAMTVYVRVLSIEFTIKDSEVESLELWAETTSNGNLTRLEEANGETRDVYLYRSFTADGDYYTLCLPFDLTAEQVTAAFGTCTLHKLVSSTLNGSEINLNFEEVDHVEAGVPYLFLPAADIATCYFPNVTIDAEASTTVNTTYFRMTGIYNPTALTSEDYFLGADNYLTPANDENPLRPFRAYFQILAGAPANAPAKVVFGPHHATGIDPIVDGKCENGKYMMDGQLYILRNGVIYNANGQMVK